VSDEEGVKVSLRHSVCLCLRFDDRGHGTRHHLAAEGWEGGVMPDITPILNVPARLAQSVLWFAGLVAVIFVAVWAISAWNKRGGGGI